MPQVDIHAVSDEALGERDWMVLVIREADRVILAVRGSAQLGPESLILARRAVTAGVESLMLRAA